MTTKELELFALDIRTEIVKAIAKKGGGHIGGSLTIADLLAVLYGNVMRYDPKVPDWEGRDFLISSKGHAGPALYAALALKGFFPMEWLQKLNIEGTTLPGHCDRLKVPGIDATTGSLGQGASIAAGIALGLKKQHKDGQYVYCITGDGESAEGQVWEAAAFAGHFHLSNLIFFLDWNKKQIDGTNDEVMSLMDPMKKYSAFGWYTMCVNGADVSEIENAISYAKHNCGGRPIFIALDVVKGSGVPCIEEVENNHCIGVPPALAEKALSQLEEHRRKLVEE